MSYKSELRFATDILRQCGPSLRISASDAKKKGEREVLKAIAQSKKRLKAKTKKRK